MSGLDLDFIIYGGDPDAGAEALPSAKAIGEAAWLRSVVRFPDVYGAVVLSRNGKELVPRRPDPIFGLITSFVRAIPFVIDGEAEAVVLSESEHSFLLERSGDDVLVSFVAGDAYEPDEQLLQPTSVPLRRIGEQILAMGERLRDLLRALDPDVFERDDYSKSLLEFLEMGRERFRQFQLERDRGIRPG